MFPKISYWLGLLVLAVSAFAPPAHAQALAKRLILKDGSYQAVTKYEIKGDRVRYLSAERGEWEEIPYSLIDWPATEKYQKERASGDVNPVAHEISEQEKAERAEEEAKTPEVSPGLHLPYRDGVFLLDTFQRQPQLVQMNQNGGEIDRDVKGNIIRSTINPLASNKQNVELKGAHATVQSHVPRPVFFVNFGTEQDAGSAPPSANGAKQRSETSGSNAPEQRYRLVRVKSKDGNRVIGNIKIAFYGKVSQQESFVPSTVQPVSGGWVKVSPNAELAPGEYALVEMLDPKEMNLFVWDFGVNPSAPENAGSWKPEPVKASNPRQEPTLEKRK